MAVWGRMVEVESTTLCESMFLDKFVNIKCML